MATFYALAHGAGRTSASRRGHKSTGVSTIAASWQGAVKTTLSHDDATGRAVYTVALIPWHGQGVSRILASGFVDGAPGALPLPLAAE